MFVICTVEKHSPIETLIESSSTMNLTSEKYINELGIAYHVDESGGHKLQTPNGSFPIVGKVDLQTSFSGVSIHRDINSRSEDASGDYINTGSIEFSVLGPDWSGPDLILGVPWLKKIIDV